MTNTGGPSTPPLPSSQTPGSEHIRRAARLLSTHGEPPGAVAAAGWTAAIAAAVTASTTPEPAGPVLAADALAAVDADTVAYWSQDDQSEEWKVQTPQAVAAVAARAATDSGSALHVNPADMNAAWAMAVGAAAAAEAVANANSPARTEPRTLPGGTVEQTYLVDVSDADGCRVRTSDGRTLLDISSGLFNTPLGHRHPAPAIGFVAQASKVAAVNPFTTTSAIADRVAGRLLDLFAKPNWHAIFAGSGSEAIETALRLAMAAGGSAVHARPNAFHGITAGAASLSTHAAIRGPLEPTPSFHHQPIHEWTGPGVGVVEPAGITWGQPTLTEDEIDQLHRFRASGGVVILDEVLSGLGRTLWPGLTTALGIPADIIVLGKGLANGLTPVSAVLVDPHAIDRIRQAGQLDHGHTHTNHPASLGAALGCLTALTQHAHNPDMLAAALDTASIPATTIGWLAVIDIPPTDRKLTAKAMLDAGLLGHLPTMVDPVQRLVIAPPLTTDQADLDEMMCRLSDVLGRIRA